MTPTALSSDRAVSPELALVDPELAERLRATAPLLRPPAPAPRRAEEAPPTRARARPTGRGMLAPLVALAAATVALAAIASEGRPHYDLGGSLPAASPTATAPARAAAPAAPAVTGEVPAPDARTYFWPAQVGVRRYAVEFRNERETVFATHTTTPWVVLPAGFRFRPGSYTWTVRPLRTADGDSRAGPPIVESTFVISPAP